TPTFTTLAPIAVGTAPRGLNLVDLNGDHLADIVVVNDEPSGTGTLTVLLNRTNGAAPGTPETITFAAPMVYSTQAANPVARPRADSNQDGVLDAAVVNSGSDNFFVQLGLTPGPLRTSTDIAWLQGAYPQLFHRPADSTAVNSWLPGLPNQDL